MKTKLIKQCMAFFMAFMLCMALLPATSLAAGEPETGPGESTVEALPDPDPQEPGTAADPQPSPPGPAEQEPGPDPQEPAPSGSPQDAAGFTVIFRGMDDVLLDEQVVARGNAAQPPLAPAIEGKTFTGWDADFSAVTADMTVRAVYEVNVYQIVFVLVDGEKTVKAEHGATLAEEDIPLVENLLGWTEAEGEEYTPEELRLLAIVADMRLTPVVAALAGEEEELDEDEAEMDLMGVNALATAFYTVYYDLDGGTGTLPVDYKAYLTGQQATALPTDAEKDGDVFAGWVIQGGDGTVYEPGQKITITDHSVTLVATYDKSGKELFFMEYMVDIPGVGTVTKTWYSDKKGWIPSAPADLFIEYGILIDLWQGQGGENKDPVAPGADIYLNNQGMNATAVSFHYVYSVTFQAGANGGFAETSQSMVMYYPIAGGTPWGSAVAMVPTPVPASGYYFSHWQQVTPAGGNLGLAPAWASLYPSINATYVFQAVFTATPPNVSVTFNVDPADGSGGKLHDSYHSGGALQSSITLSASPGALWQSILTAGVPALEAASGYYFAGWTSSNGVGAVSPTDNASTFPVTQNLTYTARFLKQSNLVVTITGHHATLPYNGTLQSVSGFDWDSSGSGVSVSLTSGAAYAARTMVGTNQMNLTASQFTVTAPAQYNVTVVIVDGYITITPAPITGTLSLVGGSGVYQYTQTPAYTIPDASASIAGTYQVEYIWRASSGSWSTWSTVKPTFQDVETYSIQARAVGTGNYAMDPPVYLMSNIVTFTVTPYPVRVRLSASPNPVQYGTDPASISYSWAMSPAPNTWLDSADPTAGFANEGAITGTSAYTSTTPSDTVLLLDFAIAPELKNNQYGVPNYSFTHVGMLTVIDTNMEGTFSLSPGGGIYTASADYTVDLHDDITDPLDHDTAWRWGMVTTPDSTWTDWDSAQPSFTDVGTYYVQAKASDSNFDDFLSNVSAVAITPAPLNVTLTATPSPVPYGTATVTYGYTPPAWLGGDYDGFTNESDIEVTSAYTATTNAGQTLDLSFATAPLLKENQNGLANYTLTWSGTLSVTAAPLTGEIAMQGDTGVYNAAPDYFATVTTVNGFNGPYMVKYEYKTPADSTWQAAGTTNPRFEETATYQVRAVAQASSPDYTGTVTSEPVEVVITPASLTVTPTVSPASVPYGTDPSALTYGYAPPAWLGGDYDEFTTEPVVGSTYTDASPAGTAVPLSFTTQPVVKDNLYDTPNYTVVLGEGSLAVTVAQLDFSGMKVNDQTKVYTTADPPNSIDGWPPQGTAGDFTIAAVALDPDDFTIAFSRVPGEDVNAAGYAISAVITSNNPNYTVAVQPADGTLTITPAPVTVQGDTLGIIYGQDVPDPTAQVLNQPATGVDVVYTTAYDREVTDVGTYDIVVTADPAENPNYTVTVVNGSLTVAPVDTEILVVIGNHFKTYGDADPELTATVTGLLRGDILRYLLHRAEGENVTPGGYEITATVTPHRDYSNIVVVPGRFTILQRPVTLAAGTYTKTVGAADPALAASLTAGNLVFEDVLNYSLSRTSGETVGSYPVSITLGSNPNYMVTTVPGVLNIVAVAPASAAAETPAAAPATVVADSTAPQTGLANNLVLWLAVALIGCGLITGLVVWRKRFVK